MTGQTYVDFHMILDPINFPGMADSIVAFRVDAVIQANYKDSTKKRMDFSFTTASRSASPEELQQSINELMANTPTKAGQAASKTKFSLSSNSGSEEESKEEKAPRPEKSHHQPKSKPQQQQNLKEQQKLVDSSASSISSSSILVLSFALAISLIQFFFF